MTARAAALVALAALPGLAAAACPTGAEPVLSCTARGGAMALDVCLADQEVSYAYGAAGGAPDLRLHRNIADVSARPWNGIGRSLWEEVTFENAGYAYLVFMSVDRMDPAAQPEGGVIVQQGGNDLARVDCDAGSVTAGFWAVSDAKARAGLCWSPERFAWARCD